MSDDIEEFDDEFVMDNAGECPTCDMVTGHEVLREKKAGSGSDFLVKCDECGSVHTITVREPKSITIPFMLSEGANTVIVHIDIDEDEVLTIGDVFEHGDAHWEINRLENSKGQTMSHSAVDIVARANAVRSDMVLVRLTLTRGGVSSSDSITVERDTVFKAGSIMEHWEQKWRIRAIHTGAGRTLTGRVDAFDIKRIYLHEPPPKAEDIAPKTPRERRQAWKEGRLGHNPNPEIPMAEKAGKSKQKQKPGRRQKKKRI
jgi:uncharacterized Zn finger protein